MFTKMSKAAKNIAWNDALLRINLDGTMIILINPDDYERATVLYCADEDFSVGSVIEPGYTAFIPYDGTVSLSNINSKEDK